MNESYEISVTSKDYNTDFFLEIIKWYEINNSDTIIIVWNHNDEIVFATKSLSKFIKYNSIISTVWYNYFPDENVQQVINHFKNSKEKLVIPNINYTRASEDKTYNYDYKCTVDQFHFKNDIFYICKFKEITDIQYLKKVFLDSETLLSAAELSAGLVHEIRNPLTSIKGLIQLAQHEGTEKEKYYQIMLNEVENLERITSELLYMAKPFTTNFVVSSIEEIIEDVLFLMSAQLNMTNIQFILNLEKNLKIKCNPSQIKQILINLIKNGSEAMKMKGHLHIASYTNNHQVVIEVIDQGEGIPQDKIREINQSFYTTKPAGNGLGLMMSQLILDIHQGELEVLSEQNKKTVFRIKLPLITTD